MGHESGEPAGASRAPRVATVLASAVVASVSTFALLLGIAMGLYPGGNFFNPAETGHHFFYNYVCDLLRDPAIGGQASPWAPRFAVVAMVVMALALAAFWLLVALRVAGVRLRWWLGAFGVLSSTGIVLVACVPSDRAPLLHAATVLGAGPLGIAAALMAMVASARHAGLGWGRHFAWPALASTLVALGLYVGSVAGTEADARLLPTLQKVALLSLLAWMLSLTRACR